ncbi:MAG: tetratricopeptide repeat protein, partial [Anaerolineales bacterium]|nr:tetratricopeptide repeat protein [Anaerolineales bacterium]
MAEIGLRTYLHQIDGLIEQRQLDDAIAHCKHILTHYPKSLDTYRHLGKALLEKSRHGDAADIFQRVLSALPDDFVAHVGMSIVREDEANLEAALWHMERAFESNPANSAIQEELRRLYGRRDGVLPSRARLTRGALARLYVKGELYPQAEAELRAALADDPERLDLSTLLARVLLETGRRAEATDLVTQILHQLPYSQEGNRLLAEILHAQNRADDAKMYRQRLEALDPYEAFADGHGSNLVNDDVVRVPELAEIQTATAEASATPDWAVSLGETTPFGEPLEAAPGDEPEWLRTGTGLLTAQPAAVTGAPDLPVAGEVPDWLKDMEPAAAAPAPELPDWMKATTGMQTEAPAEPGERPKKQTGSLSGWLKSDEPPAGAEAGALAPADLPDWMKDIAPPAADEPAAQRLDDFPEWMQQAAPVESAPSWMTGPLGPLDEAPATAFDVNTRRIEAAEPAEDLEPGALPEWLKASAAGGATAALELGELPPIDTDELRAIEAGELPAWLKAAGAGPVPAQPAEAETPAAEAEGLPDWLKAASTEPAAGEVEAPAAQAEGLPDWLKAASAEPAAGEVEAPAVEAEGLPDWLKAASAEPAAGEVEAPAVEAEGLPDWLKAIGADSAPAQPAASAVDLPDFLQPASAAAIERANAPVDWEAAPPPTPDAAAEDAAAEDGVPDWIKAMAPDLSAPSPAPAAEDALPPVAEDELPDWLRPAGAAAGAAAIGAGLAGLAAAAGPSEPAAEPAAEAEAEALPDWLTFEAEAPAPSAALTPADDMPDWLKSAMEPAAIQPAAAEPAVSEAAAPEPADTAPLSMPAAPVWLPTPAPAEAAEEPAADLPSWAQVAEPPDAVDELGYSAKDVPDWLRQPGQPAAPPAAEWLRAPAEAALPPVGEPALPDWLTPA